MGGTLIARKLKFRRHFAARLSICGDGILDIARAEQCEGSIGCSPGEVCTGCVCVANQGTTTTTSYVPSPTTSSSSRSTTPPSTTSTTTMQPPTTSTTASTTTTSQAPTTTTTSTTTTTTLPGTCTGACPIHTVFLILMENHDWSSIRGSQSAPYINDILLPIASHAEQYYNPPGVHPSEPNYCGSKPERTSASATTSPRRVTIRAPPATSSTYSTRPGSRGGPTKRASAASTA